MHSAPSARYPVSRSRRLALPLGAVWTMGAVATIGWVSAGSVPEVQWAIAAIWLALTAALLARHFMHLPEGVLAWDGQQWRWMPAPGAGPEVLGTTAPVLELPGLLLVQFRSARGRFVWCWLDRTADAAGWHAMRCALAAPVGVRPVVGGADR